MDLVGQSKWELDTPCLLVDLDRLASNISSIAATCRAAGVAWRPHAKGQKVPAIAHMERAAGAIGITCAKLGEAEVMAAAGIRDILIANQVVGPPKIARLVDLHRRAAVMVAIDDAGNAAELAAAARRAGMRLRCVIEVEIGIRRAGVPPGDAVLALARALQGEDGLELAGVMGWEGHAAEIADPAAKQRAVAEAVGSLTASAGLCREAGIAMPIVSCGGTATYRITVRQPGVTEVQAGGGVFNDIRSGTRCGCDLPYALTVLSTVVSRPTPSRVVCDAGKKAMSGDIAPPLPLGLEGAAGVRLSAEHATLELEAPSPIPAIGDKIEFVVGYADTTVHLHDRMVGLRGGVVELVWPVLARGSFA